ILLADSPYNSWREKRYASFQTPEGQKFEKGEYSLAQLADWATKQSEPGLQSGRQEMYENLINDYL
ncbi:MAG: xylose isomerase, partial [Bacteroidota bacterium]